MQKKIPIVYSKHYDIGLAGMERLHPFDTRKHGKVYRYLRDTLGIGEDAFYVPTMASEAELLSVHTPRYLDSLKRSYNVAFIAELPLLAFVPNALLQKRVLDPMRYATKGTILGAELALEYGWAVNLSGGYHHAKADSGGGFCFFADVPIALYALFEKRPELSVLIVDLDAHQGNGNETIFKDDPRVRIFDVYNEAIYPQDDAAKRYIAFDYPVPVSTGDEAYLGLLEKELFEAIESFKPGLIVFIAGTDVLEGDFLGMLRLSEAGVVKRDAIVFANALEKEIPILMLLGGGYTKRSAPVIAESIANIFEMVQKRQR